MDIAVVGAGAAGLMAAIFAARSATAGKRIVALDGARTLGAKILVAGGGRCNVTHFEVDERAYTGGPGSSPKAIAKVLRSFGVGPTIEFFRELGVELKREETGKLFPVTDDARTVLNALLGAARDDGVDIRHPWRVQAVRAEHGGFTIEGPAGESLHAAKLIIATGGMALPRSGSDGHGYSILRALGHTLTEQVFPALVPLLLDPARTYITSLQGLAHPATLTLSSGTGRKLVEFTGPLLCTHFGISGPVALDISRYWTEAWRADPGTRLTVNWRPGLSFEEVDAELAAAKGPSVGRSLTAHLPERLARALCECVGVDPATPLDQLRKDPRRALARALTRTVLPVTGDRGFTHAEVTAGGVPLSELRLDTMESRITPNLHLCGEVCDVDGRIGGFNFQWAWASGWLAGRAAGAHDEPRA
jgi:predicted Rossmann fold flavoprotein